MTAVDPAWYRVANVDDVASPALLLYPDRIEANVRKMIELAGGADRLRPHVKTHKIPEIVRLQQASGIDKFKCATIAEAEMLARCGAGHVLLAYQTVGPNVRRLVDLIVQCPRTRFATIVDHEESLRALAQAARAREVDVDVLLDIDCGMERTGIPADSPGAVELYRSIAATPGVVAGGLHAYDGHIDRGSPAERAAAAEKAIAPAVGLRSQLARDGLSVPRLVAGGSPTFSTHTRHADREGSPGTSVLWDHGYATRFPDLEFLPAALVLSRVVSRPGADRLCLDLGYKAIASESEQRVFLPDLPDAIVAMHNEEHLVIESPRAASFGIGDVLYGVPWHICPTVALHAFAVIIRAGRAEGRWEVTARNRSLPI